MRAPVGFGKRLLEAPWWARKWSQAWLWMLRHPHLIFLKMALRFRSLHARRRANVPDELRLPQAAEVRARAAERRTDVSDHLMTLLETGLHARPRLIVELGVRGGESTFVFERVARIFDSTLVSVDVEDCRRASTWQRWHFVKSDDVAFAGRFASWCREKRLAAKVDLLFVDTSHRYEHTKEEMKAWFPLLAERATVVFHDTNMGPYYLRRDGFGGLGWNNDRGVIRAIEEWFGARFAEQAPFEDVLRGRDGNWWIVRHVPECSGLTVLFRVGG